MRRAWLGLLVALPLSACTTLGPDFDGPAPGFEAQWQSPSLRDVRTAPGSVAWWDGFGDPALSALVRAAQTDNPGLRVAGLRVLESRAQLAIAGSLNSPQAVSVTAGGGYGIAAPPGRRLENFDFAFASAGASLGWELDFWGRFRRTLESADALYAGSIADFEDSRLLLQAEVAKAYFTHRTFEERLAIVKQNLVLQQRSVEITELLFRRGIESELDVQQARTQLLATQASVPQLEAGLVQTRNALALLLGRPPGPLPELALAPSNLPALPDTLAAEVPGDLLLRRPDVRAAMLRAAAQSAQIGVAEADLYPNLGIVGSLGLGATSLSSGTKVDLAIGPGLSWTLPLFGRARNGVRVQDARFEQALTLYRGTVLRAAAEVDNSAITVAKARDENVTLAAAQTAARRSLDLASLQYREGITDFQRVLDAQAGLLRQQDRFVTNRGQIANGIVDLYKALGGGWIPATEADFADQATRARMQGRTNWGTLLDMPEQER
jgi:NodT family efflux transporter outer membrane factor (OMF) lipoprotein